MVWVNKISNPTNLTLKNTNLQSKRFVPKSEEVWGHFTVKKTCFGIFRIDIIPYNFFLLSDYFFGICRRVLMENASFTRKSHKEKTNSLFAPQFRGRIKFWAKFAYHPTKFG